MLFTTQSYVTKLYQLQTQILHDASLVTQLSVVEMGKLSAWVCSLLQSSYILKSNKGQYKFDVLCGLEIDDVH